MKDYRNTIAKIAIKGPHVGTIYRGRRVCMPIWLGKRRLIVLDSSQGANDLNTGPYEVTEPGKKFYGTFTTLNDVMRALPVGRRR